MNKLKYEYHKDPCEKWNELVTIKHKLKRILTNDLYFTVDCTSMINQIVEEFSYCPYCGKKMQLKQMTCESNQKILL